MGKRSRKRSSSSTTTTPARGPQDESLRSRARDSWKTASKVDDAALAQARQRRAEARQRAKPKKRERPPGLFGPLPVSEFIIAMGLVVLIVGIIRGPSAGPTAFTIGIAMCTVAVIEITLREHLRGFRSHTLFIALLVMVLFHVVVATVGGNDAARSPILFVLDACLFGVTAFWLFRTFHRARRAAS